MAEVNKVVSEVKATVPLAPKPLTASKLSEALASSKERIEGEKTVMVKMVMGKRPEVTFSGFWNGKFIAGAVNSIARAYRLQRSRPSRPLPAQTNQIGGRDVKST